MGVKFSNSYRGRDKIWTVVVGLPTRFLDSFFMKFLLRIAINVAFYYYYYYYYRYYYQYLNGIVRFS